MKRALLLFMSTLLMGLGLQVRAEGKEDHSITINGIEFFCFKSPNGNNAMNYAQLLNGREAEGNIVIPDSVYLNGASYAVEFITSSAFRNNDKITRVEIPNTIMDIEDFAFMDCGNLQTVILPSKPRCPGSWIFQGCNLDTMELYQHIACVDLGGCTIENLYVETGDTVLLSYDATTIGTCHLGNINHLITDVRTFNYYVFSVHPELTSYYSLKAVSVEAVEPPTIEIFRPSDPDNTNLRWTVLFVPDGSEEKYSQAEFWKNFYCIKPLSEMNRYDEFVAEANAAFSEWAKEYLASMDNITKDINDCTVEGDQLQFTSTAEAEICDLAGRALHRGTYTAGESLTLPKGVSIVTVNGHCFKVAVK